MGIIEKIKEWFKPQRVTVCHYTIYFTTFDGEKHKYTKLNYCNPDAINCSVLDYFLIGRRDFISDDKGMVYPMSSVKSIYASPDSLVEVDAKEFGGYQMFWYEKKDIENGKILPFH